MVTTTCLYDYEQNRPIKNKEVAIVLAAVRKFTGENWQVVETEHLSGPTWFKEVKRRFSYEVYIEVGGMLPFQRINFYLDDSVYLDDSDSSLNFNVSAELVVAYLYGVLSGLHSANNNGDNI